MKSGIGLPVALVAILSGLAWASSPHITSPEIVEVEPDERCVKKPGNLKCRWGGSCTKIGSACYSCTEGQRYSSSLNACYSCPKGTSLRKVGPNSWDCQ